MIHRDDADDDSTKVHDVLLESGPLLADRLPYYPKPDERVSDDLRTLSAQTVQQTAMARDVWYLQEHDPRDVLRVVIDQSPDHLRSYRAIAYDLSDEFTRAWHDIASEYGLEPSYDSSGCRSGRTTTACPICDETIESSTIPRHITTAHGRADEP